MATTAEIIQQPQQKRLVTYIRTTREIKLYRL
jgi:hypothetical protein